MYSFYLLIKFNSAASLLHFSIITSAYHSVLTFKIFYFPFSLPFLLFCNEYNRHRKERQRLVRKEKERKENGQTYQGQEKTEKKKVTVQNGVSFRTKICGSKKYRAVVSQVQLMLMSQLHPICINLSTNSLSLFRSPSL